MAPFEFNPIEETQEEPTAQPWMDRVDDESLVEAELDAVVDEPSEVEEVPVMEEPVDEAMEDPIAEAMEGPIAEAMEEPVEELVDEPYSEPVEELVDEPSTESVTKSFPEPASEPLPEPTNLNSMRTH